MSLSTSFMCRVCLFINTANRYDRDDSSYSLDETDYPSAIVSDDASGEVIATFHASDYGNYRDIPAFQTFIEGIIATKSNALEPAQRIL